MTPLLSLWGPPVAWMGVIFHFSSRSDTGALGRVPDWLTHGAAYFVLGLLLCRALAGAEGGRLGTSRALLAIAIGTACGVSDEWHQALVPRREASAADVVKDAGGCSLAVLLRERRFERKP